MITVEMVQIIANTFITIAKIFSGAYIIGKIIFGLMNE